ncbi:MAG: flagellar hook-basal body complex protein FliE [Deltaproteobacteria bacterium]|nr:flagellar hook-basal body complex protein FliE [Deltaproteobacteria bacterium]MBI3295205.1 flagellar hook-basal body complex protein FliE [Deltaproteobacteria bacterium]
MTILPLGKKDSLIDLQKAALGEIDTQAPSFSEFLHNSVNEVNTMLTSADKKNTDMAVGRTENLHEAMLAFEKADSAFKLLTQVRNKAIEAYQDIMKMQV